MVVASYLGERARELLSQGGASYADATGNVRVVVSSPAIFLEGVGAGKDSEPREYRDRTRRTTKHGSNRRMARSCEKWWAMRSTRAS